MRGFTHPVLNQVYEASIRVSIQNNVHDDEYNYRWTLDGILPQGVSYAVSHRQLQFTGTATQSGSFAFTLRVQVGGDHDFLFDPPQDPDPSSLCRQSTTRTLTMDVMPY